MQVENKEVWGILEIMGHSRFAGRISESTRFGVPLVRIEVPATKDAPAFEKHFGAASIFAVTPCTEAAARAAAEQFRERPTMLVDLRLPAPEPHRQFDRDWDDPSDDDDDENRDEDFDDDEDDPIDSERGPIIEPPAAGPDYNEESQRDAIPRMPLTPATDEPF
jgi:hypothetical protein